MKTIRSGEELSHSSHSSGEDGDEQGSSSSSSKGGHAKRAPSRSGSGGLDSGGGGKDGKRKLTRGGSSSSAVSFLSAPKHSDYTETTITAERKWDASCMWNVGLALITLGVFVLGGSMFVQANDSITSNIEWEVRNRIVFYNDEGGAGGLYHDFVWSNYNYPNTVHNYYLFNCNNPSSVLKGGTPSVTEMGPYTFEEKTYRSTITFSANGDSVSYTSLTYLHFLVDDGYYFLLEDEITMVNYNYVRAMYSARGHGLTGIDYLLAEGTATALGQIKSFYTTSTGAKFAGKVGDLKGPQYSLPDRLWRHFLPYAIKELYNDLHASSSANSMNVDTFDGFTSRWGGFCDKDGCLSSSATNIFSDKDLFQLMNPGFCESYTKFTMQRCDIGFSNVIPVEFSRQLWLATDEFSFMSNSVKKDGELLGIYLWMDESDSSRNRLLSIYGFLTEDQYNLIRTWLFKLADSDKVNTKILNLYGASIGQSVYDNKKSHKNAALYQFGNGRILSNGNANVASYNDTLSYSKTAYTLDDGFQIGDWTYAPSISNGYSEFSVWAKRKKGLSMSLSTSESSSLLNFLGSSDSDLTGYWALKANKESSAAIPGVPSVSYKLANEYAQYVSDTFVLPAFVKSFAGEGALMATRKAREWIQWFHEPVNEMTMGEGDPRMLSGFAVSRNNTVLTPSDPDFDYEVWEESGKDKRVECWSGAFRRVLVSDESRNVVFDPCEYDATTDLWYSKPRTVTTGRTKTARKGSLQKFAGYDSLPKELWGTELSFQTAARQLLGKGVSPTESMTDGLNFPPLNRLGKKCGGHKCKIAVLHEDTTVPLIFEVLDLHSKDYKKLGVKRMALDDAYFLPGKTPYHTDFTMVNPDYPGMLDISSAMGTPMFMSRPHFYTGDETVTEMYTNKVMGLEPSKLRHESIIEVEYATGICASSQVRLQYNILVPPVPGVFGLKEEGLEGSSMSADPIVYPLYWVHVDRQLTQTDVDQLVMQPIYALYWIESLLIGSSLTFSLIVIGVGFYFLRRGYYMHHNPSNRLNVAGLRFHQEQTKLHEARLKLEEVEHQGHEKRAALEMRIKSVNHS